MKIGMITDNYPGAGGIDALPGGIGTYTKLVAEELAEQGHEVHVFTMSARRAGPYPRHGVTIWEWPVWNRRRDMPVKYAAEFTVRFKNQALLLHAYSVMTAVRRAARGRRFDVIESPEMAALGWLCRQQILTKRYAVRIHAPAATTFIDDGQRQWTSMDELQRRNAMAADVLTAPTQDALEGAMAWWGRPSVLGKVIGNPVYRGAPAEAQQPARNQRAVFFGRLFHLKGVDILAEAIGRVRRCFPQFRVTFIGPDMKWSNDRMTSSVIREIADRTGGAGAYEILQGMSHTELQKAVREHALCVQPSRVETFGLAFLETLAWGVPCVASDIPAYRELATPQECVFAGREDPEALAEGICGLLENPEYAAAMAGRAREGVKRWQASQIVPDLLNVWLGDVASPSEIACTAQ